jgi:hypothetical protein
MNFAGVVLESRASFLPAWGWGVCLAHAKTRDLLLLSHVTRLYVPAPPR